MLRTRTGPRRTAAIRMAMVGVALAALAAACTPPDSGTPPTTVPPAEPIEVTNATLSWSYNQYAQYGIFGPWSFTASGERVAVTQQNGQVVTGLPAEAAKTYNVINFSGGTGELDAETGEGTISWGETGDWVLNAYPPQYGAPNETLRDPILTIEADGSGSLSFEAYLPAGLGMDGLPSPAVGPTRITTVEFADLESFTATSLKTTPTFAGRPYVPAAGQGAFESCSGTGGSWPTAWIDFLPTSVRPHYYTTSCGGLNLRKPPTPFTVSWN